MKRITDTEMLDLVLAHGAWVTIPWPVTVNGVPSTGTQTMMIRDRASLKRMVRSVRRSDRLTKRSR